MIENRGGLVVQHWHCFFTQTHKFQCTYLAFDNFTASGHHFRTQNSNQGQCSMFELLGQKHVFEFVWPKHANFPNYFVFDHFIASRRDFKTQNSKVGQYSKLFDHCKDHGNGNDNGNIREMKIVMVMVIPLITLLLPWQWSLP